jgi:O-antigen/teichoic acid export membrane protein
LCWAGILYPLQSYNLNILKVKGRSDLFLRLEIIKKTYSIIGVLCVIQFGIFALLYFLLATTLVSFVINTWYSGKLINYPIQEQLKDVFPAILLAAVTGLLIWGINYYLNHYFNLPDIIQLIIIGSLYFLIYLSVSYYINVTSFKDFRQLILKKRQAWNAH